MSSSEVAQYLDGLLKIAEIPDYPNAYNGLQVENAGQVRRIAAAVDASEAAIRAAAKRGCNLLLVHHGLFWDGAAPLTGRRYRKVKLLVEHDIAVYSAHLPLDLHPELGNNALLANALGVNVRETFGTFHEVPIGVAGTLEIRREALAARLDDLLGARVRMLAGGPERVSRVGIVTGGAGDMIRQAAEAQLDAFITGEGAHHTYFDAMEYGVNVYYAGHYATETFGVRALAAHLEETFGVSWEFLDLPTGM
ncbi:MAG TPA: Nif3-like dinuclear metal center hexameric protein [Longimicrobiales bacterium]